MTTTAPTAKPPAGRMMTVLLWALRILFALAFLAAGGAKLAGVPMMVAEFETIGLGQWFRYVTGGIEIAGAIMLLWPSTVFVGALLLTCVSIGAAVAQATVIKQDVFHTIPFMLAMAFVAFSYRGQLGGAKG